MCGAALAHVMRRLFGGVDDCGFEFNGGVCVSKRKGKKGKEKEGTGDEWKIWRKMWQWQVETHSERLWEALKTF